MSLASLAEALHVLSAFWFVGGLLGRAVAHAQARRALDVGDVEAADRLGSRFERLMVRPGSLVVLAIGLLTAWLQGWPTLGFLQGSPVNWVLASLVLLLSVIPLIPLVFLPRGRSFRAALEDAHAQGHVTPRLTAALTDRTVAAAHVYEWAVVVGIVALMVAKPF
jgi:uncharacterized membrane protein